MKQQTGKTKYALISAIAMLAIAVIASVSALFAWFAQSGGARMNGAQLSVVGENVRLGDFIALTRTYDFGENGTFGENLTYKREGSAYYLYDNDASDFIYNGTEKIPLALDGLTKKETITLEIQFYAHESYDTYSVSLRNVEGAPDVLSHISYGEGKNLAAGTVILIDKAALVHGTGETENDKVLTATIEFAVDFTADNAFEAARNKGFSVGEIVIEVGRNGA